MLCCIAFGCWLGKSSYRKKKLGSKFVQLVCMRENFDLLLCCSRRRIYFAEFQPAECYLAAPNQTGQKSGVLNNHHFRNFFGRNSSMNFCVSLPTNQAVVVHVEIINEHCHETTKTAEQTLT